MSEGHLKNYKFGTKNNWRRRMWNRILDSLHVPASEATGLVLFGPNILDYEVATSKGIRACNLIGVERDRRLLQTLRARLMSPVVGCDIHRAVSAWPDHRPLHFVIADLCCNFSATALDTLVAFLASPTAHRTGACLVLNVMRGRESRPMFERIRRQGTKHRGQALFLDIIDQAGEIAKRAADCHNAAITDRDRALRIIADRLVDSDEGFERLLRRLTYDNPETGEREYRFEPDDPTFAKGATDYWPEALDAAEVVIDEYRSGAVTMDSIFVTLRPPEVVEHEPFERGAWRSKVPGFQKQFKRYSAILNMAATDSRRYSKTFRELQRTLGELRNKMRKLEEGEAEAKQSDLEDELSRSSSMDREVIRRLKLASDARTLLAERFDCLPDDRTRRLLTAAFAVASRRQNDWCHAVSQ